MSQVARQETGLSSGLWVSGSTGRSLAPRTRVPRGAPCAAPRELSRVLRGGAGGPWGPGPWEPWAPLRWPGPRGAPGPGRRWNARWPGMRSLSGAQGDASSPRIRGPPLVLEFFFFTSPQPPLALSLHSKPHKPQATKTETKKDQFEPNSIWVMLLQPSAQWSPEF